MMGKVRAVITGASRGIGRAAYDFAVEKWGKEAVLGVSRSGPDECLDMSDPDDILRLGSRLVGGKELDFLFVNHGVAFEDEGPGPEGVMSPENVLRREGLMRVNWESYYLLLMSLDKGVRTFSFRVSSVVLNASISGAFGDAFLPVYASSKGAVKALMKSFAKRWMPWVRVNSLSCGFVKTGLFPGELPLSLVETIPMGREAGPLEIIPALRFLVDCSYVMGQDVVVDGGLSLLAGGGEK